MGGDAVVPRFEAGGRGRQGWNAVAALVLDGISSKHTRRAYEQALEEFFIWFQNEPGRQFNKAAVQAYRTELEAKGLAPSSINVRLSAIRRLALEAADNGLMPPELAAGIARAKGAKRSGIRLGHWLTADQAEALLAAPGIETIKGVRDTAVLAMLLGGGLRRSELAGLDFAHIQQRDGRWLIADLVGKHGRIRTVPVPDWAYAALTRWKNAGGQQEGAVFRGLTRHGHIAARRLSPQAVLAIVTSYTLELGIQASPHDLRRTFAKLAYVGGCRLEQIQLSLGHASLVTTELYLGVRQDLSDAPCVRSPWSAWRVLPLCF